MENKLYKNWGNKLETEKFLVEIKNVIIFKDDEVKIIASYFLDNFKDYEFTFLGETIRKNKIDLSVNNNFIIKSENPDYWRDSIQYDLYINGNINNYELVGLELLGNKGLVINYLINDCKCSHCIGWNQKASNKVKYHDFEEAYKNIYSYSIDSENTEENIKKLMKAFKNYKKALEIEKTYTEKDYKKMQLASGTTEEENILMLKNNGFDIKGIKTERKEGD